MVPPAGAIAVGGRVRHVVSRPPRLRRQSTRSRPHAVGATAHPSTSKEWIQTYVRSEQPGLPVAVAGISWGGKLAVILAARHSRAGRCRRADLSRALHPRVGVTAEERLKIAWAFMTNRRKMFPIPLSDPALFTDSPRGQAFIAADPLVLHEATAGLLAASVLIDRLVARTPSRIKQSALLMQAGRDRIIDNELTLAFFKRLAASRHRGDRVSRGPPHAGIRP